MSNAESAERVERESVFLRADLTSHWPGHNGCTAQIFLAFFLVERQCRCLRYRQSQQRSRRSWMLCRIQLLGRSWSYLAWLAIGRGSSVALLLSGFVGNNVEAQTPARTEPCFATLDACPPRGCVSKGTAAALVNELKRTFPAAGTPVQLTLEDFDMLQAQAKQLVGQDLALSKTARNKLKNLNTSAGRVSEGDLIEVTGFIVGLEGNLPRANVGGESVNCRIHGKRTNDFHIPVAEDSAASPFEAIVVEMIPQKRPSTWTLAKLRKFAKNGVPVLVRGQLLYDNKHRVNDDPDKPLGRQPKRFSLWEVHPVTEFYSCDAPDKNCDPKDIAQWKLLGKVEPLHLLPCRSPK